MLPGVILTFWNSTIAKSLQLARFDIFYPPNAKDPRDALDTAINSLLLHVTSKIRNPTNLELFMLTQARKKVLFSKYEMKCSRLVVFLRT